VCLSASVPLVRLTTTSSLRCVSRRPTGGWTDLSELPEHDRGYGFVDAKTPELSIGVVPTHRGRGIGSRLLEALVVSARAQRHEALSLSVEPDNPARRLYERCGFQVVGAVDGSLTMMLVL
jgi:GNAT superfamily N-acetyltransferase